MKGQSLRSLITLKFHSRPISITDLNYFDIRIVIDNDMIIIDTTKLIIGLTCHMIYFQRSRTIIYWVHFNHSFWLLPLLFYFPIYLADIAVPRLTVSNSSVLVK